MSRSFLPDKDADLLTWGNQFSAVATPAPIPLGLSAALMTGFNAVLANYDSALAASAPGIRSKSTTAQKNFAKKAFRAAAGNLSKIVHGTPSVTDAQLYDLGLNVRAQPVPRPAPQLPPAFDLVSIVRNTAKFRAHDASTPSRRGRPLGVATISVFSHVGPTVPAELTDWVLNGTSSKTTVDVAFDPMLPMGTKVWVCAYWSTATGLNSPACSPLAVTLLGGDILPQGNELKLAA